MIAARDFHTKKTVAEYLAQHKIDKEPTEEMLQEKIEEMTQMLHKLQGRGGMSGRSPPMMSPITSPRSMVSPRSQLSKGSKTTYMTGDKQPDPTEPFVVKKMRFSSFMEERVSAAIRHSCDKMIQDDKRILHADKEKIIELESLIASRDRDIYAMSEQSKQLEVEIENLLIINDMY